MTDYDMMLDLQQSYSKLTQTQKRIAEAIVEDPEFVAFATIDKLASRLDVASSTIVRFAYRLGLDGYSDLQERVRQMVMTKLRPAPVSGDGQANTFAHLPDSVTTRSLRHDVDNLQRTIDDLSAGVIEQAVDRLSAARRIYFVGSFASDWLAEYCALSVNRIRGEARTLGRRDVAAALLDVTPEDVLVAFSFPPYASDTLNSVHAAQRRGLQVIGVTDSPISPLGRCADVVLTAHVSGVGPQNSLVGAMVLVNAVLNGLASQSEGCARRYQEIFEQMDEWNTFILRSDGGDGGD